MSSLSSFATLSILAGQLVIASSTAAEEFIRQRQLDSGLVYDYHVSSLTGNSRSPIPVAEKGSSLTLFAKGSQEHSPLYKLDATTLGKAFPTAAIRIQSEDPHYPPRTRADRPYTVSLQIQHTAPNGKNVGLQQSAIAFNPALHAPNEDSHAVSVAAWHQLKQGRHQSQFYPSITAHDPTKAEGLETFSLFSVDPETQTRHPLKTVSIQVWPVAKASILGIAPGATLTAATINRPVNIQCQDLYPDSVTYVHIYKGAARLGTKGNIFPQSVIRFKTSVPQDQTIPLGDWADTLADGQYTIEVLTITPFKQGKPERIAHTTFVIDRGMHAPSMVKKTP